MKDVQDRVVQYANRYKLTEAGTGTELGTYDFEEVTGTVQQAGTPIDKELFDSIKEDIDECVRYTAQTLNAQQQTQARENIGALGEDDIKINLNGSSVSNPSFYAPITSGNAGQVLKSMGAGQAPVWADEPKDIANASVTLGASLTFNGSAQEQTITSVVLDGKSLQEGTDYNVAENIATDAGNYTMVIMGIGDYSGTLFVAWTIAPLQGSISVSETSVNIVGGVGTTKQVTVTITSGYGDLVATSSAPNIATVSILGNTITITSVAEGNATIAVRLIGNYSAEESITANVIVVKSVLNDNTWEMVRWVADNDLGTNYWAVGDTKAITLNGTVGTKAYDNVTVWAYILGFNHNASVEGEHLIHFGCFKTAQIDGIDVTLDDSHHNSTSSNGAKWFNMNHWGEYNDGGWAACDMRYDILGSTNVPPDNYGHRRYSSDKGHDPTPTCTTNPVKNTLMAAFPVDLRAAMKSATKRTNNLGDSTASSVVTATQDYLPLLAEFEVLGRCTYANDYEENYQKRYAYYANGNSRVKYRQSSPSLTAPWWCRSPATNSSGRFCAVAADGTSYYYDAAFSWGVSPIFFI